MKVRKQHSQWQRHFWQLMLLTLVVIGVEALEVLLFEWMGGSTSKTAEWWKTQYLTANRHNWQGYFFGAMQTLVPAIVIGCAIGFLCYKWHPLVLLVCLGIITYLHVSIVNHAIFAIHEVELKNQRIADPRIPPGFAVNWFAMLLIAGWLAGFISDILILREKHSKQTTSEETPVAGDVLG